MSSHKRPHTPLDGDSSPRNSPTPKAARIIHSPSRATNSSDSSFSEAPLYCTLPPTCNPPSHKPTPLANTKELESHYAKHHAHVCEVRGCGCVFPDARLLELHQTENHDPVAEVRKERGDKIFACFLPPSLCPRSFSTPKTRRLHLIQVHGYPKQYFFAITNKGMGGLLRKWGEGVSLVRPDWKARDGGAGEDGEGDGEADMEGQEDPEGGMDVEGVVNKSDEGVEQQGGRKAATNGHSTASVVQQPTDISAQRRKPYAAAQTVRSQQDQHQHPPHLHSHIDANTNNTNTPTQQPNQADKPSLGMDIDAMMDQMSSLSLVPSSVRFGRGGKTSGMGFARAGGRTTGVKDHGLGNTKGAVTGMTGHNAGPVHGAGEGTDGAMDVEMSNGSNGMAGKNMSVDQRRIEKNKATIAGKTQSDTSGKGDRGGDTNDDAQMETNARNSVKGKGKSAQRDVRRGRDGDMDRQLEEDMSVDDASLSSSPHSSPPLAKSGAAHIINRTNGPGRTQGGPQAQSRGRGTMGMRGGRGTGYGYGVNGMNVAPRGGWIGAAMPRAAGIGIGVNGIGFRGGLPPRGGRGRARGRGVTRGGGRGGGDGGGM